MHALRREWPSLLAGLLAVYLTTRLEGGPLTGAQYAAVVALLAGLAYLIGPTLPRRAADPGEVDDAR